MKILILGGSGSGKSRYGEKLVPKFPFERRVYFATMRPVDHEDELRILKHQNQRAHLNFETIEATQHLSDYPCFDACVLVDSVTSLVSNALFSQCKVSIRDLVDDLLKIQSETIIYVSDFCFHEGNHNEFCEEWKRMLGHVHQELAQVCDVVIYMNSGIAIQVKGDFYA